MQAVFPILLSSGFAAREIYGTSTFDHPDPAPGRRLAKMGLLPELGEWAERHGYRTLGGRPHSVFYRPYSIQQVLRPAQSHPLGCAAKLLALTGTFFKDVNRLARGLQGRSAGRHF
jgi:hypothetical protein